MRELARRPVPGVEVRCRAVAATLPAARLDRQFEIYPTVETAISGPAPA